ncbi:MAG: hypothetical protein J1F03_08930 [Oscillospiraceae bacterium]|nr:hypothetical protein [Oscillospiraceae bacterium]
MNDKDAKKCKKCGATLVGKKAHKPGLCLHCARDLGQKGTGGVAALALVGIAGWRIIKPIIKKH